MGIGVVLVSGGFRGLNRPRGLRCRRGGNGLVSSWFFCGLVVSFGLCRSMLETCVIVDSLFL